MRCAALASGGKDGWLAAWYALCSGLAVERIITFSPPNTDSFMFHGINAGLVKEQAKLAGIEHMEVRSSGKEESELGELVQAFKHLKREGFSGIISGAIESEYQRERIERACVESGLVHFSPLWHKRPKILLNELLECGMDAVIVAVAADGMGEEWLGRRISENKEELLELNRKHSISPIGEGGEFETFVVKFPLFKKEIKIEKTEIIWKGSAGFLEIGSVK